MRRHSPILLVAVLYGAELLDELIYGLQGAILPDLKSDLALTYTEVGLLFTVPGLISIIGEPMIGLIGDTRYRRALVVGGIAATAIGLLLMGLGHSYALVLLAFVILYIASGAYVNLAQATLIDRDVARSEQTMARWTLVGSIGVTVAPLIVTVLFYFGYGWRGLYLGLAVMAGVYTLLLLRPRFDAHSGAAEENVSPRKLLRDLISGLRTPELLRWILLTELADLMLDKLLEVTGLYFSDVVGVELAAASGAVALFTIGGLVGNTVLLTALEKYDGLKVLRVTAFAVLVAYAMLLTVPVVWLKFALIAVISFSTAGWFPILRAQCYRVLPEQSGLVVAVTSLGSVFSFFVPYLIGRVADAFGLQWAMWLLILGPLALLIGLPRSANRNP